MLFVVKSYSSLYLLATSQTEMSYHNVLTNFTGKIHCAFYENLRKIFSPSPRIKTWKVFKLFQSKRHVSTNEFTGELTDPDKLGLDTSENHLFFLNYNPQCVK